MKKSIRKLITILIMFTLAATLSAKTKTIIKKIKRDVINSQVKTISSIVVLSQAAAEILSDLNAVDLITAVSENANIFAVVFSPLITRTDSSQHRDGRWGGGRLEGRDDNSLG